MKEMASSSSVVRELKEIITSEKSFLFVVDQPKRYGTPKVVLMGPKQVHADHTDPTRIHVPVTHMQRYEERIVHELGVERIHGRRTEVDMRDREVQPGKYRFRDEKEGEMDMVFLPGEEIANKIARRFELELKLEKEEELTATERRELDMLDEETNLNGLPWSVYLNN